LLSTNNQQLFSNYGYDYNPAKIKELLAKAGYPDGIGLPEITLSLHLPTWIYANTCSRNYRKQGLN